MKIEDITAVIRPRAPWEAADLGFALTRHHLPRLLGLWLGLIVPWWILIVAIFGAQWWSFAIIWFLKPVYDWLAVFYLGRALFGSRPTWKEVLRETPLPALRHAFDILILRRLSIYRSLLLPVRVLEGQRGAAYTKRAGVLTTHGGGTALSLIGCCGLFELLALVGVAALVYSLLPEMMKPDMAEVGEMMLGDALKDPSSPLRWVLLLSYLVAMPFVELFYVGGGFGLYLNTRTHMEGWDIDLTFRRIAARLENRAGGEKAAQGAGPGATLSRLSGWVMGALALGLLTAGATAQEPTPEPESEAPAAEAEGAGEEEETVEPTVVEPGETPGETMAKVQKHPDFKVHKRKVTYYVTQEGPSLPFLELLGVVFQVLVWVIAAALVGLIVYWLVRHAYLFNRRAGGKRDLALQRRAEVVMGLDIRPEALPPDIPGTAWRLWTEGRVREALGLLYRGTLSRLVSDVSLPIEESDTEGDCLARARQVGETARPGYLADLTSAWVGVAYGTTPPVEDRMRALCQGWPYQPPAGCSPRPERRLA